MKLSLVCLSLLLASAISLRIDCDFKVRKTATPSCVTSNLYVTSPSVFVDEVAGKHLKGNTNADVRKVYIVDSPHLEYFPKGIEEFFENLDGISVRNSGLKVITPANLKPFPNLKYLWLEKNKLEVLPAGLFRNNPLLNVVNFAQNQLKAIADNLLEPIDDLEQADFSGNACIDLKGGNRFAVRIVMREISKKCQKPVEVAANLENSEPSWVFDGKCTSATFHSNRPIRGTSVVRGKFPFVAALLRESDSKYFCGGNLITSKHVLTSAHCVQKKFESPMDANDVLVLLGRFNLNLPAERRSELREVVRIVVHESWKSYTKNSDGDLAVLVMDRPVEFNNFIHPICLVNDEQNSEFNHGFTVGWNTEGTGCEQHLTHRKTHASKDLDKECAALCPGCFNSGVAICTKEDGNEDCHNDSGRGFIIPLNNKLVLKAIHSIGDKECKDAGHSIFIEVAKYSDWIKQTVDANQ